MTRDPSALTGPGLVVSSLRNGRSGIHRTQEVPRCDELFELVQAIIGNHRPFERMGEG